MELGHLTFLVRYVYLGGVVGRPERLDHGGLYEGATLQQVSGYLLRVGEVILFETDLSPHFLRLLHLG